MVIDSRPSRRQARRPRPPAADGFLLPLASMASLMLLLSSLSLQTVSLQTRRQLLVQLQQRQQQDRLTSAAQQLVGRLKRHHACLLERPVADWATAPCLDGETAGALQRGVIAEHPYQLLSWQITPGGAELQLALETGGPTAAFALVDGELRELGLRAAAGGAA